MNTPSKKPKHSFISGWICQTLLITFSQHNWLMLPCVYDVKQVIHNVNVFLKILHKIKNYKIIQRVTESFSILKIPQNWFMVEKLVYKAKGSFKTDVQTRNDYIFLMMIQLCVRNFCLIK